MHFTGDVCAREECWAARFNPDEKAVCAVCICDEDEATHGVYGLIVECRGIAIWRFAIFDIDGAKGIGSRVSTPSTQGFNYCIHIGFFHV